MSNLKIAPHWLAWPETQTLIAAFNGHALRFVGGAVRDAVLGREASDVDAATPLPPQDVMALMRGAGIKVIATGLDHGTVTAVVNRRTFEITTLRRDVQTDGRHAVVAYTDDWREDASRRDFTMNALYCDAQGQVYDDFGGVEDARAGRVRFIGDARTRIREDALRILRFFRFFAHYGQKAMDEQGLNACTELAGLIDGLSGERIRQEMLKLLVAQKAGAVVALMQACGVAQPVLGFKVQVEPLLLLPSLLAQAAEPADPILALAALVRSGGGDALAHVEAISARWKLSNAQRRQLQLLGGTRLQLMAVDALIKRQIRVLGAQDFIHLMLLYAAEGAEHAPVFSAIRLARQWQVPVFPVTGDDLKTRGLVPGKELGETLRRLEAKWEQAGYALSKEELLARYL